MNRSEVLDTAKQYVTNDRQNDHGKPENSLGQIAALWDAYLGSDMTRTLTAVDVAHMMVLLKVARAKQNSTHTDNHVDAAGYSALAAELATGSGSE